MSGVASVYAQALYDLAKEEQVEEKVLHQLNVLDESFRAEPDFIRLLCAANVSRAERCAVLDNSFRNRVELCLLNFMKILTEKGYMRLFSQCVKAYKKQYNEDHGILEVYAITAVALTDAQSEKLADRLATISGKKISLFNRIDPSVLGGVRLDFDGKRLDDTVQHRLESIRSLLADTVL